MFINQAHKVLTIGPDKEGKGGMASVLKAYSDIYDPFYFEKSTKEGNILIKLLLLIKIFIVIPYYVFCKNIEIIHIHSASGNSFIRKRMIINYCTLFPVKIVFHLHGGQFHLFTERYGKEKIRKILDKCEIVIVLSHQWKDFIIKTFGHKNIQVINNIISVPNKYPIKKTDNKFRVLFLGKIGEGKGIFDLLQVIRSDKEYFKDKLLLKVGGNGEVEKLKKEIQENQLEGIVEYAGWVSGNKKIELLNECDLYALPSYNEGLPISVLEAMSYGKAILSTRIGGIPVIVRDKKNGFLIEPGDLKAIKEALYDCINHKELIIKYGKQSETIIKDFLPDSVCQQLNKLYEKAQ